MTEQHPVSSSGPGRDPATDPPTYRPTPAPGDSFPGPVHFPGPVGQPPYPVGQPPYPVSPQYGPLGPPAWRNPMPDPGTDYHRFLRTERNAWWKGIVAILGFVLGYLLLTTIIGIAAIIVDIATGRSSFEALSTGVVELTPALYLATNVGNALAIPLAMFLQWLIWGQPVRWLHSVTGSVRWRLLARTAVIVVPMWALYLAVAAVAFPQAMGTETPGSFGAESVALLIIMLLTTPLQAVGEEYGARGLLMRAAGSWVASPVPGLIVASLVPSLIFTLAHGARDPWLNVYYLAFGVAMSIVVWRTGGLEAACMVHVVNNMMTFGIVILSGQEITIDRSAGTGGPFMLVPMAMLVLVTVALTLWAKRARVQRLYQPTPELR